MIKYKNIVKTVNSFNKKSGNQAQIVTSGTCTTKDIALEIERLMGIPSIRSMSVLDAACQIIKQMIMDGKVIHLEELGFLKAHLAFEDDKPVAKKVLFQANKKLRETLKTASFEEVVEELKNEN